MYDRHNHLLTFDVEHWYQGYRARGSNNYHDFPKRDHLTVEKLLRLLSKYKYSATFFTTGVFAEEFPSLIREILAEGHELASHSYDHQLVPTFKDMASFKLDLKRSIEIIEDISGQSIQGFRAPKWSLPTDNIKDYYRTLVELGLKYDSSEFPSAFSGKPPSCPYLIDMVDEPDIFQFPATTISLFGVNVPVAGGLWFRLFPLALSRLALKHGSALNRPQMIYLHPYDLDPSCPRLKTENPLISIPFQLARNFNLNSTYYRLETILEEFSFCSIKDWLSTVEPDDIFSPDFPTVKRIWKI